MIDKEKVVDGLKRCLLSEPGERNCGLCPYLDSGCVSELGLDAIALLNNQFNKEEQNK